jgi:hypothetical protein
MGSGQAMSHQLFVRSMEMDFGLKGLLGSADVLNSVKKKVVDDATAKFGPHAAPIAEWVADKIENEIASKLGISLPVQQNAAADSNSKQQ